MGEGDHYFVYTHNSHAGSIILSIHLYTCNGYRGWTQSLLHCYIYWLYTEELELCGVVNTWVIYSWHTHWSQWRLSWLLWWTQPWELICSPSHMCSISLGERRVVLGSGDWDGEDTLANIACVHVNLKSLLLRLHTSHISAYLWQMLECVWGNSGVVNDL